MSGGASRAQGGAWAYHDGNFVRLREISLSPTTQALNYGTGVFEGIRAYWNENRQLLQVLKLREHYERFERSCRVLRIDLGHTINELSEVTLELLRRNGFRQDTYVRPLAYKRAFEQGTPTVGIRLSGLTSGLSIFSVPMGNYVELSGLRLGTTSWRRIPDTSIPIRAKITGSYVNTALAVDEVQRNGYDDAIFLTQDGRVSEASAANIFLMKGGRLVTPAVTADVLEGITREAVIELAEGELGMPVVERDVDRSELYASDEVFLTGTGFQIAPVVEIDQRPIGTGEVGPIAGHLQEHYFRAVRGETEGYADWRTAVRLTEEKTA